MHICLDHLEFLLHLPYVGVPLTQSAALLAYLAVNDLYHYFSSNFFLLKIL